jgi:hypothetical protein
MKPHLSLQAEASLQTLTLDVLKSIEIEGELLNPDQVGSSIARHAALFPTGRSGMHKIVVGAWRDNAFNDPMQVVSGAMGREKVHPDE